MKQKTDQKRAYHHGNLAESLLNAVDQIATQFGFDAVTLRGCAKLVGVSPSSAFRHYTDKRALLTAFATRAIHQLSQSMENARLESENSGKDTFSAIGLAYIRFALERPAFFRAICREEAIYVNDSEYISAAGKLSAHLKGGFTGTIRGNDPNDPDDLRAEELLAWSSFHGLANLFIDGPVANGENCASKLLKAEQMIDILRPVILRQRAASAPDET